MRSPGTRSRRSVITRPWILPLALVAVAFLAYALPPYLGLDPSQSRVRPRDGVALHYPLLVTHILFGSVALLTACLQVWPWLRRHHPVVHRWSGRLYFFVGVLPAGLATLVIAPLGGFGPNQQVANTMLGILWLVTSVVGYRMARQRRFDKHREWMIRSFALTFSIVANRPWTMLSMLVFGPDGVGAVSVADAAAIDQAAGVGAWMSWLVNLLLAELWLRRGRRRAGAEQRIEARARHGQPA